MLATVFYSHVTEAQRDEINAPNGAGWATPSGRAYLDAQDGKFSPASLAMFVKACTIYAPHDEPEVIWSALQNMNRGGWAKADWSKSGRAVQCFTSFPRSMMVGDLILWEDGRVERAASIGFEPVTGDDLALVRHHLTTCAMEG